MGISQSNRRSGAAREASRTTAELAGTPPRKFDPGEHTVAEVTEYLGLHPRADREAILAAEREGKNRKGVIDLLAPDE